MNGKKIKQKIKQKIIFPIRITSAPGVLRKRKKSTNSHERYQKQ